MARADASGDGARGSCVRAVFGKYFAADAVLTVSSDLGRAGAGADERTNARLFRAIVLAFFWSVSTELTGCYGLYQRCCGRSSWALTATTVANRAPLAGSWAGSHSHKVGLVGI